MNVVIWFGIFLALFFSILFVPWALSTHNADVFCKEHGMVYVSGGERMGKGYCAEKKNGSVELHRIISIDGWSVGNYYFIEEVVG